MDAVIKELFVSQFRWKRDKYHLFLINVSDTGFLACLLFALCSSDPGDTSSFLNSKKRETTLCFIPWYDTWCPPYGNCLTFPRISPFLNALVRTLTNSSPLNNQQISLKVGLSHTPLNCNPRILRFELFMNLLINHCFAAWILPQLVRGSPWSVRERIVWQLVGVSLFPCWFPPQVAWVRKGWSENKGIWGLLDKEPRKENAKKGLSGWVGCEVWRTVGWLWVLVDRRETAGVCGLVVRFGGS